MADGYYRASLETAPPTHAAMQYNNRETTAVKYKYFGSLSLNQHRRRPFIFESGKDTVIHVTADHDNPNKLVNNI